MELVPQDVWIAFGVLLVAATAVYYTTPRHAKLSWVFGAALAIATLHYINVQLALYSQSPQLYLSYEESGEAAMRIWILNLVAAASSYVGFFRFVEWKHNTYMYAPA